MRLEGKTIGQKLAFYRCWFTSVLGYSKQFSALHTLPFCCSRPITIIIIHPELAQPPIFYLAYAVNDNHACKHHS